jgi:secreted trypsin-like serine protease
MEAETMWMQIRLLSVAFLTLSVGMLGFLPLSHAGGEATVQVDVVSGQQGGSGMAGAVKKHARVLNRVGGYGGWKLAKSFRMKVGLGKTATQGVGKRSFSATLHALSASKARTTFVVVDPAGKDHKVTSQLTNGASTVIIAESSRGSGVQVFIVRISY